MAKHGNLYGYRKLIAVMEDVLKELFILPVHLDNHWTVLVRRHNGQKWILHHEDSMTNDGSKAKMIKANPVTLPSLPSGNNNMM